MRDLTFSTPSLKVTEVIINGKLDITKPSIVVNLSSIPVVVEADKSTFSLLQSRLLTNTAITSDGATVVVLETVDDDFLNMSTEVSESLKGAWDKASTLFPDIEALKKLTMHKSAKDKVAGYELNLWYLEGSTLGRIHQIHDFQEVHTQILGRGMMLKYKEQTYESAFETTHMFPGFTHYPYFSLDGTYPWHSYNAVTNCVWMAIEKHT